MFKRFAALLLSLILLLTLLPAAAADGGAEQDAPEGKKPIEETTDGAKNIFSDDGLSIGLNRYSVAAAGETYYRPFKPEKTDTYVFCSVGSSDTYGYLLDGDRNQLKSDDDSGDGFNFRIARELTAGQTYYLGVRYYSTSTTGSIDVIVEQQNPDPFDGTVEWNTNDLQFKGATPYVIANGAAQTPRFTVKDAAGNPIDADNYTYYFRENVNAGTAYVIVIMRGAYSGTLRGWFKIYLPAANLTAVENIIDGIRLTWEPVDGAAGYVVYRRAWSSKTNGWTAFARWDNTTDTMWIDGVDATHKVYAGSRYQYGVKAYFARRTDPVSGATIGGNTGDNYNLGVVSNLRTTVRITTRDLTKLVARSRKITASWSGSKNFTGYEVQSATDIDFQSNVKTVRITDPKTYSTTIGSLSNSYMYYVRLRSYHEFEGMTYYGGWSNVLCVKPGSGKTVTPAVTKYRAVVVGENEYSSSPLYGCVNDMNAMAGMLQGLKSPFTVTTLPNSTKSQILNAIRTQFKDATENDVSLFHYSGHGVGVTPSSSYYEEYQGALVAIDDQYITFTELAAELSKIKGRVVVILDSCHSGAGIGKGAAFDADAFNRSAIEAFSGYAMDGTRGAKTGELLQEKFIVITAARSSQYSYDGQYDGSGYNQGAFTAALIRGIGCSYPDGAYSGSMPADVNGNGVVTVTELFLYAYKTAYAWTSSQQVQFSGSDSAVQFAR